MTSPSFWIKKDLANNIKALVIYFSRADENYLGGSMRYIDKGNTEVVAEYIKDIVGVD